MNRSGLRDWVGGAGEAPLCSGGCVSVPPSPGSPRHPGRIQGGGSKGRSDPTGSALSFTTLIQQVNQGWVDSGSQTFGARSEKKVHRSLFSQRPYSVNGNGALQALTHEKGLFWEFFFSLFPENFSKTQKEMPHSV